MAKWYVINVLVGSEDRIANDIRLLKEEKNIEGIYDILVSKEKILDMVKGELIEKERVFPPGYIFVKMDLTDSVMQMFSSVNRISFVGGSSPKPVPDHEIRKLFDALNSASNKGSFAFGIGDKVKICDGPFGSFIGVVEEIMPDKLSLIVSVFVFDRKTPLEVKFSEVEKVKDV